jgi:hypothetical protein
MLSLPIGYIKFLFSKLLVKIVLSPVIFFFPIFHLFLYRLICFGFSFSLTRRGHGKLPTPDLRTLKVYSYNLQNQPKEEITRYPFWDYPKLNLVFCDGRIKDAHDKRKKFNFGGPHEQLLWVTIYLSWIPGYPLMIKLGKLITHNFF